jgi:cellulose synthase/poly-beta-1,6-N-acetylglucosamine synthase-like glycosyltransferase/glycosyltransferase involved in cell wall biosynthesis/O-antigen/teichoic acid export membrane protein
MKKVDIIVPILNEEENIPELVKRVDKNLSEGQIEYGIIFIDDHSTDGSPELIKKLAKKYPIKYLLKKGKLGKAYSILEGAKASNAEYVAMIDGDLQYPPEAIGEMLMLAVEKDLGVVVANRVKANTSLLRKIISKTSRFVIGNLIMGMPCDIQSGLKIFKQKIAAHIEEKNLKPWAFDVALTSTAKQLGESWGCTEIEFSERKSGKSKIAFVSGTLQVISSALKERLGRKKVYDLGDGDFVYKAQKFNTHSTLHHSKSAFQTLTYSQKVFFITTGLAIVASLILFTHTAQVFLLGIISLIYFLDLAFGFYLIMRSLNNPPEITFDEKTLQELDPEKLPVYTILCPLYRESRVLPKFIESIEALDYPKNKLEVLLLLESDDEPTIEAARKLNLPEYFKILVVPDKLPKTKPKACNYGLRHATGEYIVIYDAEDKPEPNQLKKAFLGFSESDSNVFCLQAKLNYYNPHQNLLTRLFTAEYSLWFDVILPGLQSIETTIPLGGTSNHFRTTALKEIGGWDAFNVTEDADLGVRIFKQGYRTAIFDSITLEEANSNIKNWIRQRSRWIKGYFQTYLVHTRESIKFARESKGHFLIFQLVSGLRMSFMLINPFLWTMTIAYFALYKFVGPQIEALFPPAVFYIAGTSAVFGNFLYLYYYMIGAAKRGQWEIIKYIFFVPFYWLLTSVGAFIALYQLIVKPHFWEKTIHGLDLKLNTKEKIGVSRFVNSTFGLNLSRDYISGAFLVASSMIGNVLNFLYNAYLGRRLSIEDFGLISLLGSFVFMLSVPLSGLSRTVTQRSAYLLGKFGFPHKIYWGKIRANNTKLSLILAVIWLIATPFLASVFKSETILPILILAPVIVLSIIKTVDWAFLSGSMFFTVVGIASMVEALTKLLFSFVFVEIGHKELVYLAIPISMFFAFLACYVYIVRIKDKTINDSKEDVSRFSYKFFFSSVANKITHVVFLSLDLVLAKAFLSPSDAGRYALLSLSGKMVYMIGSLFTGFITPIVGKKEGEGESSEPLFYKLLAATTTASVGSFIVFGVFGWFTAPILYGEKVLSIITYLPLYTFAIAVQTIASAIASYHQAKDRHLLTYTGFGFSLLQILIIVAVHRSIDDFVWAMSIGGSMYLFSMVFLHFYQSRVYTLVNNLNDFFGIFSPNQPVSNSNPKGLPRILIFNWRDTKHVWSGGAEVYLHEISKRLVKKGYKVTVFSGNDGKSPRNEKVEGVQIIRRGGFYTVYFWAFLYYILRLRNYFDVIIDSENGIPFFTPLYSGKKIYLLIHHVHQDVFRIKLRPPLSWIGRVMEKKIMPLVYRNTEVVTVSPSSKTDILMHKLTTKDPHVVYNGVDPNVYKPGVKARKPMVLYLGRLSPQKSLSTFIHAAKKIINHTPTVEFVIAGDGDDRKNLMKLVNKLQLDQYFKFKGKVTEEEKIDLYQKAWVFVNPSFMEGWGITTIEANACGTPVVASNVAGLRDAVHNPHSGFLVPYGDAEEFAKNIVRLIKDKKLLKNMSEEAVIWSKKFDWAKSTEDFLHIFENKKNE